ncbi:MAG: hypothetical protein WDM78_22595 [Puia sp.]
MISLLSKPWPWYVSGPAIAGIMAVLLFFGKSFGFSRNLSNICSMFGLGKQFLILISIEKGNFGIFGFW